MKILSNGNDAMSTGIAVKQIQARNLSRRFHLPILSGRKAGFFEKAIEKVARDEVLQYSSDP